MYVLLFSSDAGVGCLRSQVAYPIPAGEHEVQFVYRDGLRHVASMSIAILGLGFAMVLSGWIVRHCFQSREHPEAPPFSQERG